MEHLIVLAHRNTENNSGDIFETVNPFFALRTLASNIEQPMEWNIWNYKGRKEKLNAKWLLQKLDLYHSNIVLALTFITYMKSL